MNEWRSTAEFLHLVAGVLLLAGVLLAYRTYRSSIVATQQKNTLDKIASYREAEVEEKLHRAIRLIRSGAFSGDAKLSSLPDRDKQAVVFILNEWDELSLHVFYGVLDERLLYNRYGSLAIEVWTHLRPIVLEQRRASPKSWQAFDWLAVRWMIKAHRKTKSRRAELLREAGAKLDEALKL